MHTSNVTSPVPTLFTNLTQFAKVLKDMRDLSIISIMCTDGESCEGGKGQITANKLSKFYKSQSWYIQQQCKQLMQTRPYGSIHKILCLAYSVSDQPERMTLWICLKLNSQVTREQESHFITCMDPKWQADSLIKWKTTQPMCAHTVADKIAKSIAYSSNWNFLLCPRENRCQWFYSWQGVGECTVRSVLVRLIHVQMWYKVLWKCQC